MEHVEKMYLVPKHDLEKLRLPEPAAPNIRQSVTQRLDSEIRDILHRTDMPDDEKIKRYTTILQRYLALAKQGTKELSTLTLLTPDIPGDQQPTATVVKDASIQHILEHVSYRFKKNAELLLNRMLHAKDITSWNDRGEFIYKGNIIPGTNIVDLIRSATQCTALPKEKIPHGWSNFIHAMAELNVPSMVVGNTTARQALDSIKLQEQGSLAYSTPPAPGTRSLFIPPSPGLTQGSLLPKKRLLPMLQSTWLTL